MNDLLSSGAHKRLMSDQIDTLKLCEGCNWLEYCKGACTFDRKQYKQNGNFKTNEDCSTYKIYNHIYDKIKGQIEGVWISNIDIREAEARDIEKITQQYHSLYRGDEKQAFYGSELNLNNFRAKQTILVAEQDSKLVGYLWFVLYEHIKEKGVAYFEELYVMDEQRSSGIGKALITHAIDLIRKAGIRTIYVAVGSHMKDAQSFYEHIGFAPSREVWFSKDL